MQDSARIAAVIAALEETFAGTAAGIAPADAALQFWLRQRRYIGSGDRRRITSLFYTVLRHRLRLEWHCAAAGIEISPRTLVLAALRLVDGLDADAVGALCTGAGYGTPPLTPAEQAAVQGWQDLHPPQMPDAVRVECPQDIFPLFVRTFGDGAMAELAALTHPAPTDLRVNRAKATRADVQQILADAGITATPIPHLPDGLRLLPQPGNLRGLKAFGDGWFEPQDASSHHAMQALAGIVTARAGGDAVPLRILDLCAGAGGKTLALAALFGARGLIHAWDHDPARLQRLLPRLHRADAAAGVVCVDSPTESGVVYDAVLVDVPCSGTGVWRRHPESRTRYGVADLAGFVTRQREILATAAQVVRPGGVLMYCTCSLLSEENQDQAAWFTATYPDFAALPLPDDLPRDGLFSPLRTDTDGFFVAAWARQA